VSRAKHRAHGRAGRDGAGAHRAHPKNAEGTAYSAATRELVAEIVSDSPSAVDQRRTGARYVHGNERTAGWSELSQIHCPNGHRIRDTASQLGHTTFRCSKCGVLLWVLFAAHVHLAYVAEVDAEDVRRMKELPTLLDVMQYFGMPVCRQGDAEQ
jgi:hypothetical protein